MLTEPRAAAAAERQGRERLGEVAGAQLPVAAIDQRRLLLGADLLRFQQRVRKRQPEGGFAGLGTSPVSTMRSRLPRWVGSSIGTAESSACGYGCVVLVDLRARADLDDLAQVHDCDAVGHVADDREVVRDEEVGEAEITLERLEQVDHLRADRDVQGGDGSSKTTTRGLSASARAIPIRWR